MKVINSLVNCYAQQVDINEKLKKHVDSIIKSNKKDTWHYISRIKNQESYALKIESGRFDDPNMLEDFFACTIVVENSLEIDKAIQLIEKFFYIVEKRPRSESYTHKNPESFPFDDLRIYVKLKKDNGLPPESIANKLSEVVFEIQVKTFLQHAWSIATHDLIYKGEEFDWSKQRVAYQIKAMLEHAEISIHEIERIKDSKIIPKNNRKIEKLNKIKLFLLKRWKKESLPTDISRLSENLYDLLAKLDLNLDELHEILNQETKKGKGVKTSNLSPFFIILQSIINNKPDKMITFLKVNKKGKIIISNELEIGTEIKNQMNKNLNKIIYIKGPT